ncbi:MAG: universal stress protein [Gemmatimonadaceae bacterium]
MGSSTKPRLDRILVSVDFAEPSLTAARWVANHLAPQAEIILAHIIEPPPATRTNVIRYPSVETIVNNVHVDASERLRQLCQSIAPDRAREEIRVGVPHEELVGLAQTTGADLIAVGRQDLASSGWARIGVTAQRVLRKSPVPILLVTGAREHPPASILVAVDESATTHAVIRWGAFMSHLFTAKAIVVHAAGTEESPDEDAWIAEEIGKSSSGAVMEQRVTRSDARPAESIISEARALQSDLIVIGSSGAGAASQLLFGSVAESVLLSAPCPVLVVLPKDA